MATSAILNKQLFKKWQFWVVTIIVLGIIGLASEGSNKTADTTDTDALPAIVKADYVNKEGLVSFKDLSSKGYAVTAKYINEAVPASNADFTEQFTEADVNSCSDRLGWDAYIVSDLSQAGDDVVLTLGNEPNSNQICPTGTVDDLN